MLYMNFLVWAEEREMDFPCTAGEFAARAALFLREKGGSEEDFNSLMNQKVGQDWKDHE